MKDFKQMALSENTRVGLTITTLILMIVFIIGGTWAVSVYMNDIKDDVKDNNNLIQSNEKEIIEIKSNDENQDEDIRNMQMTQVEIRTRLVNIESRQVEMLEILKNK